MTDQTPTKRAVQALQDTVLTGRRVLTYEQAEDATRTVYEAIDTDELAHLIAEHLAAASGWPGRGDKMLHNAMPIALAVKNWLTGNN